MRNAQCFLLRIKHYALIKHGSHVENESNSAVAENRRAREHLQAHEQIAQRLYNNFLLTD